jgi:DMSO/TMAO reductase YedYZ molybdopterin-dependent catalytic subunit
MRRRDLLRAGALLGLAACDVKRPKRGILGAMETWNKGFQSLIFSPDLEASAGDVTPEVETISGMTVDVFPVYHISRTTPIAPPGWKLKIGGMVARPRELSLDDLQRLTRTDVHIEHHCVEGWSATADWHGVRLRDIAELVGAEKVDYVEFKSFDAGYWSSWDRDSALHSQTLLAYGMNGHPLTPAHGAPVRLYGAVKLGYKQVKYLTEVNFLDHETGGYWEQQGYEWYAGT